MILDKIIKSKKEEIEHHQRLRSLDDMRCRAKDAPPVVLMSESLKAGPDNEIKIIAEIKRKSPSAGFLRLDLDITHVARMYDEAGASGLSVLTDGPFFQGSLEDLQRVRAVVTLPLLRKDFIFDPYQVYEARVFGADCILLIARILEVRQLEDLMGLASELEMEALVEIHSREEWEKISNIKIDLLGINNRNLDSLKINLQTTVKLAQQIPQEALLVSESGIQSAADIRLLMKEAGVFRFLIGETLLRTQDPAKALKELLMG
ncbi:MAG: hypothetical protein A3F89_07315 [Deltaproteobacteria bacterium RIFCSPLOWO2_12_FULL_50_11]|nr:MAG: hypothetical protein A2053_06725 [Deltaproteobacteria bacterium GWA2_50_8]OGQ68772.1 MAG: hypothetical protein A3F89_07315 [Deltaproteobacteria bacterium RIFCSPLOWO2_12_FULL_50_11]